MSYSKIYFDMDGVLSDFGRGIVELCRMELPDGSIPQQEYDERLFAAMRNTDRFYFKLHPIEGGLTLFKEMRREYGDRVEILTAVPKPKWNISGADTDKLGWVEKYIGDGVKVNIVLRRDKALFAKGPDHLLIDDTPTNIEEWTAAGGDGLLFTDAESARNGLVERGILE